MRGHQRRRALTDCRVDFVARLHPADSATCTNNQSRILIQRTISESCAVTVEGTEQATASIRFISHPGGWLSQCLTLYEIS
ncbi:hypothetical protein EVAR_57899_1 [Eumeta japonica]|uniref:Uncharacterized protein n=1 Tax=Eumeta variegata TaxID=151549 RepID=A0A4C1YS29_EUMVA|nr:hypothetical protein EVAR_57899_1 [Eumeta japonica]